MSTVRNQRILVTGGLGTLGRAVTPVLLRSGYQVRLLDIRTADDLPNGTEIFVGDLRNATDVERAMSGVTGVIHAAAWHGMHLRDHPEGDFWDLNVQGTYHVYRAAARSEVRAIVFSSSMGVYGSSREPRNGGPATRVTEALPLRPTDIYGLSKVIGEEMSTAYASMAGVAGASLRYGMFVPEPFHHRGIRFLYGGVEPSDVAQANLVTMQRLLATGGHLGSFNIFSELPFDESDGQILRTDPRAAIARHWPDGPGLMDAANVAPWSGISEIYDIARVRDVLGFKPHYGFTEYLEALRRGQDRFERIPQTSPRSGKGEGGSDDGASR